MPPQISVYVFGVGIFGQGMESVPTQYRVEFVWLLIYSGNPGLESQQRLRDHLSPLNWIIVQLSLRTNGAEASS